MEFFFRKGSRGLCAVCKGLWRVCARIFEGCEVFNRVQAVSTCVQFFWECVQGFFLRLCGFFFFRCARVLDQRKLSARLTQQLCHSHQPRWHNQKKSRTTSGFVINSAKRKKRTNLELFGDGARAKLVVLATNIGVVVVKGWANGLCTATRQIL